MNLQARKIGGSLFTAEDVIEATLDTGGQNLASAVHTVEVVSGPEVTHGGGAPSGDYLHYKAIERDTDANGFIDYSSVVMRLEQAEKGTSVVKINCKYVTEAEASAYEEAVAIYTQAYADAGVDEENPNGIDGTFTLEPPQLPINLIETGEITLEWGDDTFV